MTFSGDLCHVGTSKLICKANRYFSCVMRFLPKGRSLYFICVGVENILVLCSSIRGDYARVPAPSRPWGVEGFLERSLMCWVITGLGCVFHFGTSEVK